MERVDTIKAAIARDLQCLSDDSKFTRKKAIENIKRETLDSKPGLHSNEMRAILSVTLQPVLKLLSDSVEKCRELAATYLTQCLEVATDISETLPYIFPVLVQRLGQPTITEPSEEVRLLLVELIGVVIRLGKKHVTPYLDELIVIFKKTIADQYPEVKKQSCKFAALLARTIPDTFHMQSESLIKPLLESMTHQHSKVRTEVVLALGDVLQYGNGKNVEDVVSHLAQRLFDQTPAVRAAVIQVVGNWLLDLLDRYSFHPRLIPLLLTGLTDELPDIQQQADSFWHDVGAKYESENENDLKDKQDFIKPQSEHYPPGVVRPNLGCRSLVYQHFSKMLTGIVHDIADWVPATRVKSAQLLYTLLINEEENVTQHLDKVLAGLFRACSDDEAEVRSYAAKSAELIGYFVKPDMWSSVVLQQVKAFSAYPQVAVLACILRGSDAAAIARFLPSIAATIGDRDLAWIAETRLQDELLNCVSAILSCDFQDVSQSLFNTIVCVMALHRSETTKAKAEALLFHMAERLSLAGGRTELFQLHAGVLVDKLVEGRSSWTQNSVERAIFEELLLESGRVVGQMLPKVIPIFVDNVQPERDAELRLKCFLLLSRLLVRSADTVDSEGLFNDYFTIVVQQMVIPNLVWHAGRTASAIRSVAITCLWALLQSSAATKDNLLGVLEELMVQLRAMLEDDNKTTRLTACRATSRVLQIAGPSLECGRLHNMYPDLLKRLDDSSDEVRVAACHMFVAYVDSFQGDFQPGLYRAHLEAMYQGLLLHLDDPSEDIQNAVLEVLQKAAHFEPHILLTEVDNVKHKHRSTKYCDLLSQHVHNWAKDKSS